jgi:hypothetical protein
MTTIDQSSAVKQKRTFAASQISGFNSPELPKKRPCIPPPIPEVAAIEVF